MNSKSFLAITGLVLILLATGTYMAMGSSETNKTEKSDKTNKTEAATATDTAQVAASVAALAIQSREATTPPPTPASQNSPAVSLHSLYKNGTYIASGTYNIPEGMTETIKVSVTLKNDVIIDSRVAPSTSNDHESQRYQKQFIAGYKVLVTGKKISDVNLSVVSGSSLTSSGWNSAVASIEAQAKV